MERSETAFSLRQQERAAEYQDRFPLVLRQGQELSLPPHIFFIIPLLSPALDQARPESKVIPLPINVIFGPVVPQRRSKAW